MNCLVANCRSTASKSSFVCVFGGMYIYQACFIATANAPFGSSFSLVSHARHLVGKSRGAPRHRPRVRAAAVPGAVVLVPEVGRVSGWSALLLLALPLGAACCWSACLLCAVLRFCLVYSCYKRGTPFWFVFVPAGGNCFALGTGGIRWSLLVGGLGPVLSFPKLCFKPFRRLSAVGFVLGWHREPLFNNLAGVVGYCIYDGRNH